MCFFHQITLFFYFFSSDFCYIVYYLLVFSQIHDFFFLCIRSLTEAMAAGRGLQGMHGRISMHYLLSFDV